MTADGTASVALTERERTLCNGINPWLAPLAMLLTQDVAPKGFFRSRKVLGGEQLNAADFQIATSLRLAMSLDDLRPAIERRPAGELALRVVPHYPGRVPPVLPAAWLEPLASGTASAPTARV